MDHFIRGGIAELEEMQNKIANGLNDLGAIIARSKKKMEQFRSHKQEYYAAEEYARFGQLMKDLALSFVLDSAKASKYKIHALDKDYYDNTPVKVFNQYMSEYHNKVISEGVLSSYKVDCIRC